MKSVLIFVLAVCVAYVSANCQVLGAGNCYNNQICSYSTIAEGAYWCNLAPNGLNGQCGYNQNSPQSIYQAPVVSSSCPLANVYCQYYTAGGGCSQSTDGATSCTLEYPAGKYLCVAP